MGSSSCGQGWRGRNGRGSSRRLGRSRQQRGRGLAGAHWSMLNRGADGVGSKRQQVMWAPGLGRPSPGCGVNGKYHLFCTQSRMQVCVREHPKVLGKSSSGIPAGHDQTSGRGLAT